VSNGKDVIERTEVEALYRTYGSVVFRRARALLGSEAEASDAVQDVFIRVLRSFREFRGESSPMTWLYRITTNLCLNRLRDRRRRADLHQELAPEQAATGRRLELTPDVRKLLASLPDDAATAGVYYYLDTA
jgi:RNA polymerase sigma factor (sigma-70 family)